jgi:hypothetical protein
MTAWARWFSGVVAVVLGLWFGVLVWVSGRDRWRHQ